jgi:threonine/homoserine/homoserine lactone efflux protein
MFPRRGPDRGKVGNTFRAPAPNVAEVDAHLLLAFWGVALVLIAVPGPDWAFVLATGGRDRVVLRAVAGLVIGYCLLTAVVAAGLGEVLARSPAALTVLTAIGAGYLVWLGAALLRHPAEPHAAAAASGSRLLRGIGVSGLNPKGLLIFLAMLPQFTDAHGAWPVQVQLAALGLVFAATCGAFYTVVGLGARLVSGTPRAARLTSRISGTAMIAVGAVLVAERIRGLRG